MRIKTGIKSQHSRDRQACRQCGKLNRTQIEARQATIEYCARVPVSFQFGEMNFYYCNFAQSWHIGHRGKSRATAAVANRIWGNFDPVEFRGIFD